MQSTILTNALLALILILVLLGSPLGPGGCYPAARTAPVGRFQVVSVPNAPENPVLLDTATGDARPLEIQPHR